MISASEIGGLMAMMPAFATDNAGDPAATATISLPRLETGLKRMIDDGADVIATTGSFGECHTLSLEEFETITRASAEIAAGRVPLFIGVTSLNTREVIRKMKIVEQTGAQGVLVGVPFYFPASAKTAVRFFKDITEACPSLAVMVYHNPPCHNITLKLPIMAELLKIPNCVAMKDSHRTPIEFMQLMELTRGKMSVFANQLQYRAYAPLGAAGMWSINAWMGPWPLFALRDAVKRGDYDAATAITLEMASVNEGGADMTWRESALKVAIKYAGYVEPGPTRPPFAEVPPEVDAAQRKKAERWHEICERYRVPAGA
jgi:dihydrodipicolinate synthase/N-acetylneuraminate lyase